MKEKSIFINSVIKRLSLWAIVVAGILLIPFVTNAPWTGSDYVFAGIVLSGAVTAYVVVTQQMSTIWHKLAVGLAVLAVIGLIMGWAATGP